jgi:hypothetical protein
MRDVFLVSFLIFLDHAPMIEMEENSNDGKNTARVYPYAVARFF